MFLEYVIETVPAPSGGPLVLLILNIMEQYGFNETDPLYYHRLIEAIKFAYGTGQELADPELVSDSKSCSSANGQVSQLFKRLIVPTFSIIHI